MSNGENAEELERYHDTTHLADDRPEELAQRRIRTGTQNGRVLDYFRAHRGHHISVAHIYKNVLVNSPYASSMRAVSDLTRFGYLTKTDHMVMGDNGARVHTWLYNRGETI